MRLTSSAEAGSPKAKRYHAAPDEPSSPGASLQLPPFFVLSLRLGFFKFGAAEHKVRADR